MKNFELIAFATADELAQAVARAWLGEIETANRGSQPHNVALSGGRITLKFFAAVIESSGKRGVSLQNVHYFWADERCVPVTDPESSFAAADKYFFQPLGVSAQNIHRIPGEQSPESAAETATAEIRRIAPANPAGQPVLDIVFLGMGEDGHVASLFPAEAESALTDKAIYRVVRNSPKPPPDRVTLSYSSIAVARQVWVLASGAGKEAALRETLKPDGNTPLARVLKSRRNTRIFSDIAGI